MSLITYKIIRVPIARIATEVCASVNASEIAIWYRSCVVLALKPALWFTYACSQGAST
jgi:hypothetical protein